MWPKRVADIRCVQFTSYTNVHLLVLILSVGQFDHKLLK